MTSVKIAPSLLAADFSRLKEDICLIEKEANLLHLDVMDGQFVPPISFGEVIIEKVRACTSLYLETHLMTLTPSSKIKSFVAAGSQRLIIHQEADLHLHRCLEAIKHEGASTGVAINPATPVETLFDILDLCDVVLVMSVNPGWGGQKFIPHTTEKIKKLHDEIRRRNLSVEIEVDGGIDPSTGPLCVSVGASLLVAGSAIFKASNPSEALQTLRRSSTL